MKTIEMKQNRRRLFNQVISNNSRAVRQGLLGTLTVEQWKAALDYFEWKCPICGGSAKVLCVVHWIPLSREGCPGTTIENVIPLCVTCNANQSNRTGDEWLRRKYSGDKLRELVEVFSAYRVAAPSLWATELTVPASYTPKPFNRHTRGDVKRIPLEVDLSDPSQRAIWDYYQELTFSGQGNRGLINLIIGQIRNSG